MTIVPLATKYLPLVRSGIKTSTIRKGLRSWSLGPALIAANEQQINIVITQIKLTTVAQLCDRDALTDGFSSLDELLRALQEFYPQLSPSDKVTIAYFRTADG